MPCQSDYLAASGQEMESVRVCLLISYVCGMLKKEVPEWIVDAANNYYGNVGRLDEATKILCELCRSLTDEQTGSIVYNARDERSRQLASWWERHQEWDKRRVKEENETRAKIINKERALNKLTKDEIEALGL